MEEAEANVELQVFTGCLMNITAKLQPCITYRNGFLPDNRTGFFLLPEYGLPYP